MIPHQQMILSYQSNKDEVIAVYKPLGLTPLETLERLRRLKPELEKEKLSYAGRLDPLAEGVMPVLVGRANLKREQFLNLDKTYEAEFIFGCSTDTGDLLGCLNNFSTIAVALENEKEKLKSLIGSFFQEYPKYSSPRLAGSNKKGKEVSLYSLDFLTESQISGLELFKQVKQIIKLVKPGFRQTEILLSWQKKEKEFNQCLWPLLKVRLNTSAGFYVRGLTQSMEIKTGAPVVLSRLIRLQAGDYSINKALKLA